MPADMTRYGKDWDAFSRAIRFVRALSQCECTGQCGLHHSPHERRRCREIHHQKALFANGRVRLTVAHLCACDPPCQNPNHVIAACQRCHLRIDRYAHARHRLEKRQALKNTPKQPPTKPQDAPPGTP